VHDIGIAASFDPVALDHACVDMVNAAPSNPALNLKTDLTGKDKFKHVHPNVDWQAGLLHAQKLGLGQMEYEIINV
jgi:uncharacterized Fe-S center protein